MAEDLKIHLTVVVSGSPERVTVDDQQKVAQLMRKALKKAKLPDGDLSGWNLRFASGGEPIPPEEKIARAGITDGATLFLNRDAGGGGQVAAADPAEGESPVMVVDPEVSEAKLDRELEDWEDNHETYSARGWILLGRQGLEVDIGFAVPMPIGQFGDVPSIPLAVRLGFDNYDVWPPSLHVIDPITRRWLQVPRVAALDFTAGPDSATPLNLFIVGHPLTRHVFLCKQGVREYHSHPEHSGDDWLLYRHQGYGTLGAICDLLWRTAVRTVAGLDFLATRTPIGDNAAIQHAIEIRQGDIDAQAAAMQPPEGAAVLGPDGQMQLPPEIQAQIAAQIQAMGAGRPG